MCKSRKVLFDFPFSEERIFRYQAILDRMYEGLDFAVTYRETGRAQT
jgi:hypothetical protein